MRMLPISHINVCRYEPDEGVAASNRLSAYMSSGRTEGYLMFPECRYAISMSPARLDAMLKAADSPCYFFTSHDYMGVTDEDLMQAVLRRFPPYNEDEDPLLTEPAPFSPLPLLKDEVVSKYLCRGEPRPLLRVNTTIPTHEIMRSAAIDIEALTINKAKHQILDVLLHHDECWEVTKETTPLGSLNVEVGFRFERFEFERFKPDLDK